MSDQAAPEPDSNAADQAAPDPENYDAWLDRKQQDPDAVTPLLAPFPAERMKLVPVSTLVNSMRP